MAIVVLVYMPGLHGPFLFDDVPNILRPMAAWMADKTGWQELVFGNHSGPLGRPLSMATFVANAALTGLEVWPFKATNLAIHLLCGITLFLLLSLLLERDQYLSHRGPLVASLIAVLWLIHPMQVSTVLYVVQRMAQLSALFTLLGLLFYVRGRIDLEQAKYRGGLVYLFLLLPMATLAAVLSKENGALVPLYCAVIELGYFRSRASRVESRCTRAFFVAFLALPALLGSLYYLAGSGNLLRGYDGRLFTMGERLLSQPRAILDYIGSLLLPRGPSLGIYTDDFLVSRSLFDPPSTFWSILGLTTLVACAVMARTRIPAFFVGIGLYLAGHVLESTIFPLELYFEHRNYLPSFGLFLALAGLCAWAIPNLIERVPNAGRFRRVLWGAVGALFVLLAGATWARSGVWSSWMILAEQGIRQHPHSRRAHLDYISILLAESRNNDAREILKKLEGFSDPGSRHTAVITSVWLDCYEYGRVDAEAVARVRSIVGAKLELAELLSAEKLGNLILHHSCSGLSKADLGYILRDMTGESDQRGGLVQVWRIRFMASRLFAAEGLLPIAIEQSALAWMTGRADAAVGVFLANLYYVEGDCASARLILRNTWSRVEGWDRRNERLLKDLEKKVASSDKCRSTMGVDNAVPTFPDDERGW